MHFYHLIFAFLDASRMNEHIFEASKIYENIFNTLTLLLKRSIHFRRVVHIFDTSKKTLNYSSIFPRRVENVQDASLKYATIFQCYFGRVKNYIYDLSARIIKNPLNSTTFWTRTVPPSFVVHEPAHHAGSRTDCEYIEWTIATVIVLYTYCYMTLCLV